jgi:hypothetical protein
VGLRCVYHRQPGWKPGGDTSVVMDTKHSFIQDTHPFEHQYKLRKCFRAIRRGGSLMRRILAMRRWDNHWHGSRHSRMTIAITLVLVLATTIVACSIEQPAALPTASPEMAVATPATAIPIPVVTSPAAMPTEPPLTPTVAIGPLATATSTTSAEVPRSSPPATPTGFPPTAQPAVADVFVVPATGGRLTLPVHLQAKLGQPDERVDVTLRWQDGTQLEQAFTLLRGEDGQGLLIGNLDWVHPGQRPPEPPTQAATIEVRNPAGQLLARRDIVVVSPSDPETIEITLYWVKGETLQPERRRIPRTQRVATAALEELLWGPRPGMSEYVSAIPTPEQVLNFPGRRPGWGPRVTLRGVRIEDGVATADFSEEMEAYGGGSLRVMLISQQIRQTLLQFPTVREVHIAIEGRTDEVLQP